MWQHHNHSYDLLVTEAGAVREYAHSSTVEDDNCVFFSGDGNWNARANLTATWASSTPLAERLELLFFDGAALNQTTGPSPLLLALDRPTSGMSGFVIAVQAPADGVAVQQAVELHIDLAYTGPPMEVGQGSCSVG